MKLILNKFISIALIIGIVSVSLNLGELSKMPILVKHYQEYKADASGDSLLEFLFNHYLILTKATSEADRENDCRLPFKSPHKLNSQSIFYIVSTSTINYLSISINKHFALIHKIKSVSGFHCIWQPPKIA